MLNKHILFATTLLLISNVYAGGRNGNQNDGLEQTPLQQEKKGRKKSFNKEEARQKRATEAAAAKLAKKK